MTHNQSLTDAELESFEDGVSELGDRVSEFLAEGSDQTPEDIEQAVREYDIPDPLNDRPVDD